MLEWKTRAFPPRRAHLGTRKRAALAEAFASIQQHAPPILQQPASSCMKRCLLAVATGLSMVVLAGACTMLPALPRQDATSAAGSAPSATVTPVVWFPATSTATSEPHPTAQPTADKKPGVGDIVLTDDFSSPADWNTAVADEASVAITDGGLTIAAQPGVAPVASFLQGKVFGDMYVEVTASPSLCRGADAYGLAFRPPTTLPTTDMRLLAMARRVPTGSVSDRLVSCSLPRPARTCRWARPGTFDSGCGPCTMNSDSS